MKTENILAEAIQVGQRKRSLVSAKVEEMARSISDIGLRTPLTVRVLDEAADADGVITNGVPVLVAGHHRLAAVRQLGWETVPCIVLDGDERDARLWEIAENLHRADLSAVERAEHVDEWRKLTLEKVAQVAPPSGGDQPAERGHRKTAETLGISREAVRRAEKIAALPRPVRDQAREEGWSQDRLLNHAKPVPPPPPARNDAEAEDAWLGSILRIWNKGAPQWRERFLSEIDTPVFDRTKAAR